MTTGGANLEAKAKTKAKAAEARTKAMTPAEEDKDVKEVVLSNILATSPTTKAVHDRLTEDYSLLAYIATYINDAYPLHYETITPYEAIDVQIEHARQALFHVITRTSAQQIQEGRASDHAIATPFLIEAADNMIGQINFQALVTSPPLKDHLVPYNYGNDSSKEAEQSRLRHLQDDVHPKQLELPT